MGDWKSKVKNVSERAAHKVTDPVVDKAHDTANQLKGNIKNSSAAQFLNQKGLKNKAKFLGGKAKQKADDMVESTELGRKLKSMFTTTKRIAKFTRNNAKTIAICSSIIILGSAITFFCISLAQSFGASPHYYCDIEPDEAIEASAFYQQYCVSDSTQIKFSTMNGHYIVQDGQGPSEACAIHNMALRFWYLNDLNWYAGLWGADGNYQANSRRYTPGFENKANTVREWIIGGSLEQDPSGSIPNGASTSSMGSLAFAQAHGSDYTGSNWGYVRDPNLSFRNNADAYQSLETNENWVWDLSAPNNTTWNVNATGNMNPYGSGGFASIMADMGGFATLEEHTDMWTDPQGLIDILYGYAGNKKHPEGIVVVKESTGQALLVTGFDSVKGCFTVIDSGLGLMGGFEGPIISPNFCVPDTITNEMLFYPEEFGIYKWYCINPQFENAATFTNGFSSAPNAWSPSGTGFVSGQYPSMIVSRRTPVYGAPASQYGQRMADYAMTIAQDRDANGNIVGYLWVGNNGQYEDNFRHFGSQEGRWDECANGTVLNNYDCSGLAICCAIYGVEGTYNTSTASIVMPDGGTIYAPHQTSAMYGQMGVAIPLDEIQPGDILLFSKVAGLTSNHAGIYVGYIDGVPSFVEAKSWDDGVQITPMADGAGRICEVIRIYGSDE